MERQAPVLFVCRSWGERDFLKERERERERARDVQCVPRDCPLLSTRYTGAGRREDGKNGDARVGSAAGLVHRSASAPARRPTLQLSLPTLI